MTHILECNLKPLAEHQGGEEPVHVIKVGKAQKHVSTKHLKAAARVVRPIVKKLLADAVSNARAQAFGDAVLAFGPPPAHHAEGVSAGGQTLEQPRRVRRVILTVSIQGDHKRGACAENPGPDRSALTGIVLMIKHSELGNFADEGAEDCTGPVSTGVIDKQDFKPTAIEGARDFPRKVRGRPLFVEDRDDNGDIGGRNAGART